MIILYYYTYDIAGARYTTKLYEIHPDYVELNDKWRTDFLEADVAVIYLNEPIKFPEASALRLHSELDIDDGDQIKLYGYWGRGYNCAGCSDYGQLELSQY